MFCGKCGNNIPDGAVVCPACGAPTGAAPAPGAKKPNKNLIAGIVGVVVVIALVIVLISSCGGGSPESMAEDFVDAVYGGNGEDVWDAVNMDAYLDLLVESGKLDEDEVDDTKDDIIGELDNMCEQRQDSCEEQYGKDWDYELEVTKVKDLKNSDLRSFENSINDDDTDFEVTEGLAVTVKVTVTGDEDDDFQKFPLEFYKVDGEWIMDPNSMCGVSPESMAEDYVDALYGGSGKDIWYAVNMDKYLDLAVESGMLDEDEADDQKDEAIDYLDSMCEWIQDSCEEQYGKDWDYELEVTKVKDLKNSELRSFENSINADDSDLEVTEGVAVTVKVTVTGDEDDDFEKYTIEFYKVDGEWIMDPSGMF